MAPITTASNEETHAALLDQLDTYKLSKPFRNPAWKPTGRRNKNLKQILSEAQRAQQSVLNTQQNSGASTPVAPATDGSTTPSVHPNPAQASQDLTRLVLEKNLSTGKAQGVGGGGALTPGGGVGAGGQMGIGPSVTYTSIAAAPSFKPKRKYCDITGLPAKYTEPTTGLHYYNKELYPVVRGLSTSQVQEYKAARGAATVLK
jgi:INO80 complex subunit C